MHVLTVIAPPELAPIGDISPPLTILRAMLSPVRVVRLSSHAVDLHLEYRPTAEMGSAVYGLMHRAGMDAVIQPLEYREKRLLISDMDSTMIGQECIDELADKVGKKAEVSAVTARAMNGEIEFKDALRARVALLKDLPETVLEEVFRERIRLMPGALTLLATMRARGAFTVLVSGGFDFFTSRVAAALGFHAESANQLEVKDGRLTGQVIEPILDKQAKKATLLEVAAMKNIPLQYTLAVGDGANDLPMLQTAGLGVAYHAKPVVEERAHAMIRHNDLTALLYLQGIPKDAWMTDGAAIAA